MKLVEQYAPVLIVPLDKKQPSLLSEMAYGPSTMQVPSSLYRVERGVPFLRRGQPVTLVPQFKGLSFQTTLSTSVINQVTTPASLPSPTAATFVTTSTSATVAWPKRTL